MAIRLNTATVRASQHQHVSVAAAGIRERVGTIVVSQVLIHREITPSLATRSAYLIAMVKAVALMGVADHAVLVTQTKPVRMPNASAHRIAQTKTVEQMAAVDHAAPVATDKAVMLLASVSGHAPQTARGNPVEQTDAAGRVAAAIVEKRAIHWVNAEYLVVVVR